MVFAGWWCRGWCWPYQHHHPGQKVNIPQSCGKPLDKCAGHIPNTLPWRGKIRIAHQAGTAKMDNKKPPTGCPGRGRVLKNRVRPAVWLAEWLCPHSVHPTRGAWDYGHFFGEHNGISPTEPPSLSGGQSDLGSHDTPTVGDSNINRACFYRCRLSHCKQSGFWGNAGEMRFSTCESRQMRPMWVRNLRKRPGPPLCN